MRTWVIGGLASALVASAALAREPTAEERGALKQTLADFSAAMKSNDMRKVVSALPPRLLAAIAKSANLEPDALAKMMAEQMGPVMQQIKITAFALDLDHASFQELPSGAPYAFIPTATTAEFGERKAEAKSQTLAMMDGKTWYLVRLEQAAQVQMFLQAYPEFANVKLDPETMTVGPK